MISGKYCGEDNKQIYIYLILCGGVSLVAVFSLPFSILLNVGHYTITLFQTRSCITLKEKYPRISPHHTIFNDQFLLLTLQTVYHECPIGTNVYIKFKRRVKIFEGENIETSVTEPDFPLNEIYPLEVRPTLEIDPNSLPPSEVWL
jgi:hypothetical protein